MIFERGYEHEKINVAIIGYGRSGCDIHSAFFKSEENDIVNVVAVFELDPMRADAAKDNGCVFTVFQQSRLAPYFKKLQEVLNSGVLGGINSIKASYGGFSRRYDWQTAIRYNAGAMRNTAPHPFEQILHLADTNEMPTIFSKLAIVNSVGDAEDYVKAILTYPGKPLYEIEINPSNAYNDYMYRVYGDRGCLSLTTSHIKYKYYLEEECPQPKLDLNSLHNEDGTPAYCTDNIMWHEVDKDITGDAFFSATSEYYHLLYKHMFEGGELFIKPEKIKIEIAVFEEISRQNPLEEKF